MLQTVRALMKLGTVTIAVENKLWFLTCHVYDIKAKVLHANIHVRSESLDDGLKVLLKESKISYEKMLEEHRQSTLFDDN